MSDPVLDLWLEQLELAAIEAESMSCPSYEGQGFFYLINHSLKVDIRRKPYVLEN